MPNGCFVILLPKDQDYKVLGYYLSDKRIEFQVSSDLFLRLNLDHEKNEFNILKIANTSMVSYLYKIKGKASRKATGIIIGLLLNEDESPEKFQNALKEAATAIENVNFLEISSGEFEENLEKIYVQNMEATEDTIDPATLKESIINRTKEMLSGGKKERKTAKDLLDLIEANDHIKVADFHKQAVAALKEEDYEKASKLYTRAAEIAESLLEIEVAKTLRDKAKSSMDIPASASTLEDKVKQARTALRNEQFNVAYVAYKTASEIAKKLMLSDEEEEYRLKSKALQDFYQIDQRFKKK